MKGQNYYYNNKTKNICLINKDLLGLLFKNQKIKNASKILSKSYEDIVKSKDVPFEAINKNYYKWKITNTDFIVITLDKSLDETLTFLKIPTDNYKQSIEEANSFNKDETVNKILTDLEHYLEDNLEEDDDELEIYIYNNNLKVTFRGELYNISYKNSEYIITVLYREESCSTKEEVLDLLKEMNSEKEEF